MKHINRYALENRLMLDLITYELYKLQLPHATEISVYTHGDAFEDLQDRVGDSFTLLRGDAPKTAKVAIYLFSLEDSGLTVPPQPTDHLLVGFQNRMSHKSLLYSDWKGFWYPTFEHSLKRAYHVASSWGILGPGVLWHYSIAEVANRLGRFDLGYHLADRSLHSQMHRGRLRYLCPLGLIVGHRRD